MTDTTTETTEAAKANVPGAGALASIVADLGFMAGFAWVGGIALNHGFGVSVPFVAAWLLLVAGLWLVQLVTGQLAATWHNARVKADINLLAASMAAQDMITGPHAALSGLGDLADFLGKLDPENQDNGGCL
jgi:predicted MFS family arabinose efflux permease